MQTQLLPKHKIEENGPTNLNSFWKLPLLKKRLHFGFRAALACLGASWLVIVQPDFTAVNSFAITIAQVSIQPTVGETMWASWGNIVGTLVAMTASMPLLAGLHAIEESARLVLLPICVLLYSVLVMYIQPAPTLPGNKVSLAVFYMMIFGPDYHFSWQLAVSVLFGVTSALFASLFPYPVLASSQGRTHLTRLAGLYQAVIGGFSQTLNSNAIHHAVFTSQAIRQLQHELARCMSMGLCVKCASICCVW